MQSQAIVKMFERYLSNKTHTLTDDVSDDPWISLLMLALLFIVSAIVYVIVSKCCNKSGYSKLDESYPKFCGRCRILD